MTYKVIHLRTSIIPEKFAVRSKSNPVALYLSLRCLQAGFAESVERYLPIQAALAIHSVLNAHHSAVVSSLCRWIKLSFIHRTTQDQNEMKVDIPTMKTVFFLLYCLCTLLVTENPQAY